MPVEPEAAGPAATSPGRGAYYVYVLRSLKDGRLYTGSSADPERRLERHSAGMVATTRHRRPLRLVYCEKHVTETQARSGKRYLKTWAGRMWLKGQLDGAEGRSWRWTLLGGALNRDAQSLCRCCVRRGNR
jgi:putative endonuclease